ncbi:MAG: hypothetical protein RR622_09665 [Hydrogenoanaerobacterium sp.]
MSKNKTAFSTSGTIIEGLSGIPKGTQCEIYVDKDLMWIKRAYTKDTTTYNLNISQLSNIGIVSEEEVTEKNKNVIGRAIVGGLVFGSIGAILGGLSGVSNTKKKETTFYLVINYTATNATELSVITFQVSPIFTRDMVTYVQDKIALLQPKSISL